MKTHKYIIVIAVVVLMVRSESKISPIYIYIYIYIYIKRCRFTICKIQQLAVFTIAVIRSRLSS